MNMEVVLSCQEDITEARNYMPFTTRHLRASPNR